MSNYYIIYKQATFYIHSKILISNYKTALKKK